MSVLGIRYWYTRMGLFCSISNLWLFIAKELGLCVRVITISWVIPFGMEAARLGLSEDLTRRIEHWESVCFRCYVAYSSTA